MNGPSAAGFEIHSEPHGPHWVAWISRPGEPGPLNSILLVGATRAEAEEKAVEWAERTAAQAAQVSSSS